MSWKFWTRHPPQPVADTPKDWESIDEFRDLPVQLLIALYSQEDNCFIVFINHDGDVDYKTIGQCDQKLLSKDCGKILSRIAVLEAVPVSHLPVGTRIAFRAMLGEGLARSLHDDHANAKSLLDAANQFVSARNQEVARRWFVCATSLAVVGALCAAAVMWLNRESLTATWGEHYIPIAVGCAAGATGAYFSVLTRAAKIPLDPTAGRLLHYMEGGGHVVAGMIGAVFVYLAMKAGIVAPKLLDLGLVGQALACMVGGASERLVPTIIRKVDVTKADTAKNEK